MLFPTKKALRKWIKPIIGGRDFNMPTVVSKSGKVKKYSYTKKGKAAAKRARKKSGRY